MQPAVDLLRGKHGKDMYFISTAGNKPSRGKNSGSHRSQSKTFNAFHSPVSETNQGKSLAELFLCCR